MLARFLQLDLLILLILIPLVWSGGAPVIAFAFMVLFPGAIILGHVVAVRRLWRLGLPSRYVQADRRARAVRCVGPCVLFLLIASAILRQN